jgi:acetyl esterase
MTWWDPEFRDVVAALPRSRGDLSDPAVLAVLRDPGPDPSPEPDVTWTSGTVPNTAGDHQVPVRIYRPAQPHPNRPGYVHFHGGGLSFGSLNTEHRRCVALCRDTGAVGVSVDFRMAPDHPPAVILDDGYSVLRRMTEQPEAYDVDPRRLAVTGASGGGMLTLAVAQMARDRGDTAPALALALYPNTDDRALPEHASRREGLPVIPEDAIAAVMANLGPPAPYIVPNRTEDLGGLCPAVLLVGQNDPLRDEVVDHAWRLLRAGVPTELHVLPGLPHAFDLLVPQAEATRHADTLMARAFRRFVTEA